MSLLNAVAEKDPIGKTKQLSVRLRPEVHEMVKVAAKNGKTSVNELLGRLIETAAMLPAYADSACRSFDEFVRAPSAIGLIRSAVNDQLNRKLPEWIEDRLEFPIETDDIVVTNIAFWPGSLEFAVSWDVREMTRVISYGQHNSWSVRVCRGGRLYFAPDKKLRLTDDTLRVDVTDGEARTAKAESEESGGGFIDDDLPF